ncbi:NAD(P)-dependent oxidoreductase [Bradyrhizobium sp. AC87j1]|uniref:NAD(P)-dependent oxidoreductase n=1 Tax=Bradyrhizobium sp. AC87j1 TaxID=2055894 RepID=UPI0024BF5A50|nr:NAD(P)-dependent oxidoreductase [Bradyrhizobium sp. AC87j1]
MARDPRCHDDGGRDGRPANAFDQRDEEGAPVTGSRDREQTMAGEILGVIGTGRMGGPMAGRLMDAGYSLVVYDTQAEATQPLVKRGALLASSPADVASRSDIVLASLPTPDIVKAVALGQDGISSGNRAKIVIDLSTSGPGAAKFVAEGLKAKGMTLVDAPVSGGIKGAVNGSLAVMVSCPQATYDTVQPILKNFGKLFYTGDKPGVAQTAKLANNLMAAAALVITSEAVAMGVKGGVNAKVLIDIINASSGRNSASEDKFPRAVLPGTFDFGFATGLSYKDVRLCVDEAEAMGVPMVCGAVVRQMLAITNAKYGASSDFTSIAKVLEEWAGVEMRG